MEGLESEFGRSRFPYRDGAARLGLGLEDSGGICTDSRGIREGFAGIRGDSRRIRGEFAVDSRGFAEDSRAFADSRGIRMLFYT